MKLAAFLALSVVGASSEICRNLKFTTGDICPFGFSTTDFKIMPFGVSIPSKCRDGKGAECTVKVCGSQAQFSRPFEVVAATAKVNSWNFDVFVDKVAARLIPKSICSSVSKAVNTYCCGVLTRMDGRNRKAVYEWPATGKMETEAPTFGSSNPSSTPSRAPTRLPSRAPTRLSSRAPTSRPTSTPAPTDRPSRAPTPSRPPTRVSAPSKPCKELSFDECKANDYCKASNGKKGKVPCGDKKCKKFKKSLSKCLDAPHCKPGKIKNGKMSKCLKK